MKRIQLEKRTDLKNEIPLSTPYCIFIDPSSACNFKCKFCMNQKIKHPEIMKFDLFKKIIDDLDEFPDPVKTIRLYGFGEPLMNKSFCDMVKYARASKKVLAVDTTTNGSLLTPELIDRLIDSGIDRINISIEAVTTEKYREFTGNPNVVYEKIVDAVARLHYNNWKMTVFVKINGDYLTDLEKVVFTDTFKPISDGCDIEHTMNCWNGFDAGSNNKVGIYGQPLKEVMVCPYVFYSFMIHADGDASACFLDWKKELYIADAKIINVKNIWDRAIFKYFRTMMLLKKRKEFSQCKNCNQLIAGMPVDLDEYTEKILEGMIASERMNDELPDL